jgi:hypothetical protein
MIHSSPSTVVVVVNIFVWFAVFDWFWGGKSTSSDYGVWLSFVSASEQEAMWVMGVCLVPAR